MGYTDIPQFSHTHILSTRSAFEPRGLPGDIPICNRPPFARMPAAANAAVTAERASGHVCRNRGAACFLPGTQPKTGETDGVFWTGLYLCVCVQVYFLHFLTCDPLTTKQTEMYTLILDNFSQIPF